MTDPSRSSRRLNAGVLAIPLIVLLGLSVGANLVLLGRMNGPSPPKPPEPMSAGTKVIPFEATLDGKPYRLDYTGQPATILYFYLATCGWCERNWSNISALRQATEGKYRLFAVSLSPEPDSVAANRMPGLPVLSGLDDAVREAYNVVSTPRTVVISNEGRVLADWIGAYDAETLAEIEKFFGIKLPGLDDVKLTKAP